MRPVAVILATAIDDVFQAEGAVPGGQRWDPLAESTIQRHPRRAGGMILQDTGLMANVNTQQPRPFTVRARSPAPYAGIHLEGSEHIPKRDFFAVDEVALLRDTETYVLAELARWTR